MKKMTLFLFIACLFWSNVVLALSNHYMQNRLIVLCYHHISKKSDGTPYVLDPWVFSQQIEYLRTHGFHFVSVSDVLKAKKGIKPLPPKAVLISFDDAYESFYDFVYPLFRRLNIPSVLAVVGNWIEKGGAFNVRYPLMTWKQIREVAQSGLVEIASHTYNIHHFEPYTPQGNIYAAASVLRFLGPNKGYETMKAYKARIERDFKKANKIFQKRLGFIPRVLVLPYGEFTDVVLNMAKKYGYKLVFSLEEGINQIKPGTFVIKRLLPWPDMRDFIQKVEKGPGPDPEFIRAVQVDLDLIYDPDPKQTEENLGRLIERLLYLGVNTVFLQGFADPDGDGIVKEVYFPNSVLPVRADLLGHVANRIFVRGINVFIWMPTLNIWLRNPKLRRRLCVISNGRCEEGKLSPFLPETRNILGKLYQDLASHVAFDGILFQDDATLSDEEDNQRAAQALKKHLFHIKKLPKGVSSLARVKTLAINSLLNYLKQRVKSMRPEGPHLNIRFARNMFAPLLLNPRSENWFAQNYNDYIRNYDYTVVMAYCQMEGVKHCFQWLKDLSLKVKIPERQKVIFKVQAFNWQKNRCVNSHFLLKELRLLQSLGIKNIAYYPDDLFANCPDEGVIKNIISTKDYPFGYNK